MNKFLFIRSTAFSIALLFAFNSVIVCQNKLDPNKLTATDSLTLKEIIGIVITNHPAVKASEELLNNADARIQLAKTGYYPEADLTANISNMGPVTKLTIPDMGTFQLFPENNYSASINYRQLVYDFGRTSRNIEVENAGKALGEQTIEQVKQKLSLATVSNFYALVYLQAAIKIKEEQLVTLEKHLDHVEKMLATGSGTEYSVFATKVKISTVESQKVDLQAALTTQQAALNSLLGSDNSYIPIVKNEFSTELTEIHKDSIFFYALQNRDEVILNEKRTAIARLRYDLIGLQNKPVLNFIASGGAKNGYVPYLNRIRPNYVIGLGIKIPLFDGMKNKYNLMQAQSAITSLSYESELTKRDISNELSEAEAYFFATEKKMTQSELQLMQALIAYSLAETSFKSGMITNLDLLDANNAVSESRLMFLKAKIDYAVCTYKLKNALGERLYQEV